MAKEKTAPAAVKTRPPASAVGLDFTIQESVKRSSVQVSTAGSDATINVPSVKAVDPADGLTFLAHATDDIKVDGASIPVTALNLLVHRLSVWAELIESMGSAAVDTKALQSSRKAVDEAFEQGLSEASKKQQTLEATYRGLDQFYTHARTSPDATLDDKVRVANVSVRQLVSKPALLKSFAEELEKFTNYSLEDVDSILVLPGWAGSVAGLQKLGELAEISKSLVITDFVDCTLKELDDEYAGKGGFFDGLKGKESWKSRVLLAANHVRVRMKHRYEERAGLDDLYIAPSMLFAGAVFRSDEKHETAASVENKPLHIATTDGSKAEPRWKLKNREKDFDRFREAAIPLVWRSRQLVFWGSDTLSSHEYWKQYPVRRVKDYIDKMLQHHLNAVKGMLNEDSNRSELFDQLHEFIRENVGKGNKRMLDRGEIKSVEQGRKPEDINIEVELTFKMLATYLNLKYQYAAGKNSFKQKSEKVTPVE